MATKIEWTGVTDNIIVVKGGGWWCRKISEGCKHCYAARLNQTPFFGGNRLPYSGPAPTLGLRRDIIDGWAKQRTPRKHFVASMTDVFGEWVEREWIFAFLDGMAAAPRQTFQVLTKRPALAAREIQAWLEARGQTRLPGNVWLGTSVENQEAADLRVPYLASIPAAVRFLSCEPLLGPLNLFDVDGEIALGMSRLNPNEMRFPAEAIDWVIVGGESGANARPMHPDWVRSIRDQCAEAEVAFFFKQWGVWKPIGQMLDGESDRYFDPKYGRTRCDPLENQVSKRRAVASVVLQIDGSQKADYPPGAMLCYQVGKEAAGRLLDGRMYNQMPGEAVTV